MKDLKDTEDVKKVKKFLLELDFICNSTPTAQNLIYSKNGDIVVIKNNKNK